MSDMGLVRRLLVPGVTTVLVVVVVAALFREAPPPADQRLPELRLERLGGGELDLAALAGRPVVINLWATWCGPCRRELPMMTRMDRERPDVAFVFVNHQEQPEAVRRYLVQTGVELERLVLDPRGDVGRIYRSPGLPTTLFFDADGTLVGRHVGEIDLVTLFNAVADLIR
jgi:cytochrome c biogenesis protein CcmG, thiol:disulfide interchange protein DsbE